MKMFAVSELKTDKLVSGSPQYPMWTSKEPDIYVSEIEYDDDEYNKYVPRLIVGELTLTHTRTMTADMNNKVLIVTLAIDQLKMKKYW